MTDRPTPALQAGFARWVDSICKREIPPEAVAFSFNLAETSDSFVIDLIGAPRFDALDQDWACDDVFRVPDAHFELPYGDVGRQWEPVLALAIALVRQYLGDATNAGERLRMSQAVGVGFVDGDLEVVWPTRH